MKIPNDVMKDLDIAQRFYKQNKKAFDSALINQEKLNHAVNKSGINQALQSAKNTQNQIKNAVNNIAINSAINNQENVNRAIENAIIKLNKENNFSYVFDEIRKNFKLDYYSNNNELYLKNKDSDSSININNAKDLLILDKIIDNISVEECTQFINHLSEFPLLGLKHDVGERIYSFISQHEKVQTNDLILFRIRISTDKKQIPYTIPEMFEPQFRSPKQNRFSMSGLNPLYLCSNLETAKSEVRLDHDAKYTIIELKLISNLLLLDICDDQIPLFNFCHHRPESQSSNLNIEYLIPNFIADCAKYSGFDGIRYSSVHNPESKNIVLFHTSKRDFKISNIEGFNY